MNVRWRRRPHLESLESMTLLSGVAATLAPAAAVVSTTPPIGHEIDINGTARGSYEVHHPNPDVGATYTFNGSGALTPIGRADVLGNIHTLGNVMSGNARGHLFLVTTRGTLTLSLEGPEQDKPFAPIPDRFTFKITNASGKYLHDTGQGTVVLVLDPASATSSAVVDHGSFTMVFLSNPSPTA